MNFKINDDVYLLRKPDQFMYVKAISFADSQVLCEWLDERDDQLIRYTDFFSPEEIGKAEDLPSRKGFPIEYLS